MNIVKCKFCNETGQVPLPLGRGKEANSRCPVCKGTRELFVPGNKRICPDCLGAKKIPVKVAGLPDNEPCGTCGATGFVDA